MPRKGRNVYRCTGGTNFRTDTGVSVSLVCGGFLNKLPEILHSPTVKGEEDVRVQISISHSRLSESLGRRVHGSIYRNTRSNTLQIWKKACHASS
jgi:hypothetical protein